MIWFSFHKKSALSDEQILGYLLKEQVREVHARERVVCERVGGWASVRACVFVCVQGDKVELDTEYVDDEFMKMMNLGNDLLNIILPFILSKISRVS